MSAFKAAVAADVAAVFINTQEFGDVHTIDGRAIPCVVDSDLLQERSRGLATPSDGVFVEEMVVFVATVDLDPPPVIGQWLRFDGQRYCVKNISEAMGVLEITLVANET